MTKPTNGNDELLGSDLVDVIKGLDGNDTIYGFAGNDKLYGNDGDDILIGGTGSDLLDGGSGNDTADYSYSSPVSVDLTHGVATDTVNGDVDQLKSIENVIGSNLADTITGNDKANVLDGGGGDDLFFTGKGADTIIGGKGKDYLYYSDSKVGVEVSLTTGLGHKGTAEGDHIKGIEVLAGSAFGDQLTGDKHGNTLVGFDGNDILKGLGGNDELFGGDGDDKLFGGDGDDFFGAGAGHDHFDGGSGKDTVDYSEIGKDLTINLGSGKGSGSSASNGDTFVSIENIEAGKGNDKIIGSDSSNVLLGNDGNDTLSGRGGYDTLNGGAGNDTLSGGEGKDVLSGGTGYDMLTGGAGADTFKFLIGETGSVAGKRDIITDFQAGTDKIDLSGMDADAWSVSTHEHFTFVGEGALLNGTAGVLHYRVEGGNTIVEGDYTGDGQADFQIELTGVHSLTAGDFIL